MESTPTYVKDHRGTAARYASPRTARTIGLTAGNCRRWRWRINAINGRVVTGRWTCPVGWNCKRRYPRKLDGLRRIRALRTFSQSHRVPNLMSRRTRDLVASGLSRVYTCVGILKISSVGGYGRNTRIAERCPIGFIRTVSNLHHVCFASDTYRASERNIEPDL